MTTFTDAYEDLTLHQQISPEADAVQGWPLHFPDGSPPLASESTAVRSQDWYGFRDPNQSVYVGWVASAHEAETALADGLARLREAASSGDVDSDWLRHGVAGVAAVLPYADRTYFRVLSRAQRLALSDTVTFALVFGAADALRHVEHGAAGRAVIEDTVGEEVFADVEGDWSAGEGWQPLRAAAEQLLATTDWVEALVAVNVILEPLVGGFLREHYLDSGARRHGDAYTAAATATWRSDSDRARRWTFALIDHLLADPAHGSANRAVIAEWADRWEWWAHRSVAALTAYLSQFSTTAVNLDQAWADVLQAHRQEVGERWSPLLIADGAL